MNLLESILLIALGFGTLQIALSNESNKEKIETSANNVKRSIKRGAHHVEESLCKKGTAKCIGKQIENRATELKDATVDGIKDLKNKAD